MHAQLFVVLSAVTATSLAYPTLLYSAPFAPVPAPIPAAVPVALKTQYHAQDELGQYTYGYSDGLSAKSETKSFNGVTVGGYAYLDSEGKVQNVNYVSDAAGFRVAATNLPVAPVPPPAPLPVGPAPVEDTPEVAAAKAAHLSALKEEEAKAAAAPEVPASIPEAAPEAPADETPAPAPEAPAAAPEAPSAAPEAPVAAPEPAPAPAAPAPAPAAVEAKTAFAPAPFPVPAVPVPAAFPYSVAPAPVVPAPFAPAPVVYAAPAPVVPGLSSQYHSQDELGQYSYGYIGGPSSKAEVKTFDGVTRGAYSYLDANGLVQSTNYISDPHNGFRVAASNLPVAPGPVAIPDSPEVADAKAKHFAALAKAAAEAAEKPE